MISAIKKLFGSSAPRLRPGQAGYKPGVILFVDDEPDVRSIARQALEPAGYEMIDAADGQKALELFYENQERIGLVITDVLMPKLDGLALANRLHKEDADLPILLLSGHVLEEDLWAPGNARMRYLMKPYRLPDLEAAVIDLIGPGGSSSTKE
ncbi:MAG TPA: response regulator [Opitutaceae bacterium]|nr:response regulator [Opitutaceae bacterium]